MRLSFFNIQKKETFNYKGNPKIYNDLNHTKNIVSFNSVGGKILVERVEEVCIIRFKIVANLTVLSSVSNEPFSYKEKIDEVLCYTNRKSYATADYIILEEKDYIEIEDVVYSLLVANLPIKLHKRFETYPEGENFKVYSEDDYLVSKEESGEGNPFDALKDLDLDENDVESGEESLEIAPESEENKEN